jgi:hypothetical protein
MGLPESRLALSAVFAEEMQDLKVILPLADAWFKEVKKWEAGETFPRAFGDNRMTVRQIELGTFKGGSFPINNIDPAKTPPQHLTPEEKKALLAKGDEKLTPEERELLKDPRAHMTLARDRAGIEARSNPKHFFDPETGKREKNKLGLHDLSATLLNGERDIHPQLAPYDNPTIVVFMPVPKEKDLQVFAILNDLTKRMNKDFIREMRSKLTRVKLAQVVDMHTGYVDISDGNGPMKVRYGHTGLSPKEHEEDAAPKGGSVTAEDLQRRAQGLKPVDRVKPPPDKAQLEKLLRDRKAAALRYKKILVEEIDLPPGEQLPRALVPVLHELNNGNAPPPPLNGPPPPKGAKAKTPDYNEIVMAYRAHESGKFPLFTRWDAAESRFWILNEDGSDSAAYITNKGEQHG